MGQFGSGYKEQFHFKPRFLENLSLALAVYPEAKVDVDERGLDPETVKIPRYRRKAGCGSLKRLAKVHTPASQKSTFTGRPDRPPSSSIRGPCKKGRALRLFCETPTQLRRWE